MFLNFTFLVNVFNGFIQLTFKSEEGWLKKSATDIRNIIADFFIFLNLYVQPDAALLTFRINQYSLP